MNSIVSNSKVFFVAIVLALFQLLISCSKEQEKPLPPKEAAPVKTEPTPAGYQSGPVKEGGTITGRVVFKRQSNPSRLSVTKDREVCGTDKRDPSLIVGGQGEVRDAVVQISDIRQGKPFGQSEAVLDQVQCEYQPHVLAIPAGTAVKITNSDGILHNVHTLSKNNTPFNRAQPKYLKEITETFAQPEMIPVRCDVHGWMSAWIFVADHPYYDVSSAEGTFRLTEVPPGSYTLEVWHEALGKQSRNVQVGPNEKLEVVFEFLAQK